MSCFVFLKLSLLPNRAALNAAKYNPIKRRYFVNKPWAWHLWQGLFCLCVLLNGCNALLKCTAGYRTTVTVDVTKHTMLENAWHLATMVKGSSTGPTQGIHYEAVLFSILEKANNKRVSVNGWLIISHMSAMSSRWHVRQWVIGNEWLTHFDFKVWENNFHNSLAFAITQLNTLFKKYATIYNHSVILLLFSESGFSNILSSLFDAFFLLFFCWR